MEKKNSVGKYILVFEPKYVNNQCAISFDVAGNASVVMTNKYTDTPCGSKAKVKKNCLSDIDRITASTPDLKTLFEECVPKTIFSYYGNNLHKMFIGYMHNGRMRTLNYVINNPELVAKLNLVQGSRIYDHAGISSMINLAVDSDEFYRFILKEKNESSTNLSSPVISMLSALKVARREEDQYEQSQIVESLHGQLTYYKEYRELFLLTGHYQDKLAADKKRLETLKTEVCTYASSQNHHQLHEVVQPNMEQLSFFDEMSKVKRK
ncbi:MAG: hypothetical protein IJO43_01915 [Bacilli bacterium]|nr:hypothetical protein [Bacilli bacterium]